MLLLDPAALRLMQIQRAGYVLWRALVFRNEYTGTQLIVIDTKSSLNQVHARECGHHTDRVDKARQITFIV